MSYPTNQPPPPGFNAPPNEPPPAYQAGTTATVISNTQTNTYVEGKCPTCGGHTEEEFTACGIILAILFFPIGILCCLMMKERRCRTCRPIHTGPEYVPIYYDDTNRHRHHPHRPIDPFPHHHHHHHHNHHNPFPHHNHHNHHHDHHNHGHHNHHHHHHGGGGHHHHGHH